jgi:cation transport ATPase
MCESWNLVPDVLKIARQTMKIGKVNLAFTMVYNIVIPFCCYEDENFCAHTLRNLPLFGSRMGGSEARVIFTLSKPC